MRSKYSKQDVFNDVINIKKTFDRVWRDGLRLVLMEDLAQAATELVEATDTLQGCQCSLMTPRG